MKVFISWSGSAGQQIAVCLKEWLEVALQSARPFMSSADIEKGARWSQDIARELQDADFGLVVVTPESIRSEWVMFESGALSKAVDKAKVCPILFGVKQSDLSNSPLLQFQASDFSKEEFFRVFKSINASLPQPLHDGALERSFDVNWMSLENKIKETKLGVDSSGHSQTSLVDVAEELLFNSREALKLMANNSRLDVIQSAVLVLNSRLSNIAIANDALFEVINSCEKLIDDTRSAHESGFFNNSDLGNDLIDRLQVMLRMINRLYSINTSAGRGIEVLGVPVKERYVWRESRNRNEDLE